jgi:holo-[acyl-carrier protein] synthase
MLPTTGAVDPFHVGRSHDRFHDMIGIGIDVVEIERFRRSLERTPTMRERLFTDVELAYVAPKADPVPSLAARFAAREAVMKALGLGLGAFGFHDVWIERAASGVPSLAFAGRAAALADQAGVQRWHVSLTHSDLVAVAYVIAE